MYYSVIAQWVERPTEKNRRSTDAGSSPRCSKGFFSQSQLSVQTVLLCPYSPRVQSHASTSVCTLTIPNTGSHATVWTHEILHTLTGMGGAALAAAVSYPGKATRISRKGQSRCIFSVRPHPLHHYPALNYAAFMFISKD